VEVPATGSWPVITRGQWRSVYRRFRLAIECSGRVTAHSESASNGLRGLYIGPDMEGCPGFLLADAEVCTSHLAASLAHRTSALGWEMGAEAGFVEIEPLTRPR
jgi:hypothetical protein